MDLHSIKKQPGRMLLLALMGTSLLLLFINQAGVKTPFLHGSPHPSPRFPVPSPSRRIQDYQVGFDDATGRRSSSSDQNGVAEEGDMAVNETKDLLPRASAERATAQALQKKSNMTDTLEETVQEILRKQRNELREAMNGYSFHPALKAKCLEDLVPESGGQPVRSLVITTWRSGSTFIAEVPISYFWQQRISSSARSFLADHEK